MTVNLQQQPKNVLHSIELEEAVIAALLLERNAFFDTQLLLGKELFTHLPCKHIYEACESLAMSGVPIDLLTATKELEKLGTLDAIGGVKTLTEITQKITSSANIKAHAAILRELYMKRKTIETCTLTAEAAKQATNDIFETLETHQTEIAQLVSGLYAGSMLPAGKAVQTMLENIFDAKNLPDNQTIGVTTGLQTIDSISSGLRAPDMIVLAARPGMGKTALALNIALAAAKSGEKVAFFSLEMSTEQLLQRIVSTISGVQISNIRNPKSLTDEQHEQLLNAAEVIQSLPIYIDDTPGLTINALQAKSRQMKIDHGIGLIVLDYLQLMSGTKQDTYREQVIATASRGIKLIAKELEIPVLALSQLNRSLETRDNKRPRLSDLRESGAIEQDADLVFFLYRPEMYGIQNLEDGTPASGFCELIVAKNRHGAVGTRELFFDAKTTTFQDIEQRDNFTAAFQSGQLPDDVDYTETPF